MGDFKATSIDGSEVDLSTYDGQVLLVVNVASQCGRTPQYAGLQELHEIFGDQGLTVLGFPCDQFGNQEPGTEAEIAQFCETSYGVSSSTTSRRGWRANARPVPQRPTRPHRRSRPGSAASPGRSRSRCRPGGGTGRSPC
nr:glutathione peroxidase [Nocardioides agariphilus]